MDATKLPLPLRTLDAAAVLRRTRALFAGLSALLGAVMFDWVGADHAVALGWVPTAILGAILGALVAPAALRSSGRTFARTLVAGLAGGVVISFFVLANSRLETSRMAPVALAYGAAYGLLVGMKAGVIFGVWSMLARRALDRASADSAELLSIQSATLLGIVAGGTALRFHSAIPHAAAVGVTVASSILVVAAMLRVSRLAKIERAVTDGSVAVVPRSDTHVAVPLVWAPSLDHVLVRQHRAAGDAAPFREQSAQEDFAVVPGDFAVVRKALGRTVLAGIAGLAIIAVAQVAVVAVPTMTCSACDAPCQH